MPTPAYLEQMMQLHDLQADIFLLVCLHLQQAAAGAGAGESGAR